MEKDKYPTSVFCIIATEFCERFSFCGLRTILSLYLRNELLFPENTATVIYHVFIMVCYVVPIAGAICADSFLGRYRWITGITFHPKMVIALAAPFCAVFKMFAFLSKKTILDFSLIYLVGNLLMCVASIPIPEFSPIVFTVIGLTLIAIGTGGIKPCVAAFGADQFHLPYQRKLLQQFFSIFYFSINLGGFVGMILTPVLRKVTCFGEDTCYALGFGFPAALMLLALLLFILGKHFYRLKAPKENIILQFIRCAFYALVQRSKNKKLKLDHWLDYSKGKYSAKLIYDMKIVCAVLWLFTPLPIFWSLFDQQGSRWTFQASRMDGTVLGAQILPDQMQVINPAIVLVMIPVFDRLFYPFLSRIHVLECPLHRMAVGGLIAGFAFLSAGILELVLETTYPELPDKQRASLNFINTLPCRLSIENPFDKVQDLEATEMFRFKNVIAHNCTLYSIGIDAPEVCGDLKLHGRQFQLTVLAVEYQIDTILVGVDERHQIVTYITDPVDFKKSLSGKPRVRITYIRNSESLHNVTVALSNAAGFTDIYFVSDNPVDNLAVSSYMELAPGVYEYVVRCKENGMLFKNTIQLELGGVYTLALREHEGSIKFAKLYTMSPPNSVNMLWLIPQYFLISVAEIMFGIAGLEFSFTQAPKCLKTVTIAAWYLSVALGNLLVIIITQARFFKSQAHEFFLFAMLIVADMMVFTEMAVHYRIVQLEADSSAFILQEEEEIPLIESATILKNKS